MKSSRIKIHFITIKSAIFNQIKFNSLIERNNIFLFKFFYEKKKKMSKQRLILSNKKIKNFLKINK